MRQFDAEAQTKNPKLCASAWKTFANVMHHQKSDRMLNQLSHHQSLVIEQLDVDGYVMLERLVDAKEIESLGKSLVIALEDEHNSSTLRSRGKTYGSRNLLETVPDVRGLLKKKPLHDFAVSVLGNDCGIVRALFFDKPPDRSWSLPWHRDRTIAVERNDLPSEHFQKPTTKAGVAHVEAPTWLLSKMLTFRIHLDAMTETNGPLCVLPGSHRETDVGGQPVELHAHAGDVLAMRPLLSHASAMSRPGCKEHRRVVHIELAGTVELPDRYAWYSYLPLGASNERSTEIAEPPGANRWS